MERENPVARLEPTPPSRTKTLRRSTMECAYAPRDLQQAAVCSGTRSTNPRDGAYSYHSRASAADKGTRRSRMRGFFVSLACLTAFIAVVCLQPGAAAAKPIAKRGDVKHLPKPLKDRLIEISKRPHTYLPLQVFAEADSPSQLFQYYLDRKSTRLNS